MAELSDIAFYVTDKISSESIAIEEYVTTDNILQNKVGRTIATNLPPNPCSLTLFHKGDVLVANIRPYLKKIWKADKIGGASNDVLVFRAKSGHNPDFLYSVLLQDSFFDHCMKGAEGAKMPRGNKTNILRFPVSLLTLDQECSIGSFISNIDKKIELNRQTNCDLEAMAKQIYDYWFVQFDFPNEEGKPYKSSGGKMVWNEALKREIPMGWKDCNLLYYLTIKNGRDHKHLAPGVFPVYGSGGEMRRVDNFLYSGESVLMPRKGTLNNIMYVNETFWTVDTMFFSEMKILHCAKYVYLSIKDIDFSRWDSGTGVPSMTASTLYSIPMVKVNANVLKAFDEIVSPLFLKVKQIKTENELLNSLRDSLLPLLMNGQATING